MSRILAEATAVTYPFPSVVFGIIAMGVFLLLGFVTWSYRDVANRHDHKADNGASHH
ncbi:MAG: hypothetical protein RL605_410 [Actinomycetota bacterium]|jgi:hypothetical protein